MLLKACGDTWPIMKLASHENMVVIELALARIAVLNVSTGLMVSSASSQQIYHSLNPRERTDAG